MENYNPEFFEYLLNQFEERISNQEVFYAKIVIIKENGVNVKLYGLYGYISFNYMPWRYNDSKKWLAVFPYLKDFIVVCKLFIYSRSPVRIILNAEIHKFKKIKFDPDEVYNAVIISVFRHGFQVELGYHFNWKCGSHVSYIDRSVFSDPTMVNQYKSGTLIELLCKGFDSDGNAIFVPLYEPEPDEDMLLKQLIKKEIEVEIVRDESDKLEFLVEGRYTGIMPVTPLLYPNKKAKIIKWTSKFQNGDKIKGNVISVNYKVKSVMFQWIDIDEYIRNYNKNRPKGEFEYHTGSYVKSFFKLKDVIKPGTTEKIQILFTDVDVVVTKIADNTSKIINVYTVNHIYEADLVIYNQNYHITQKEKELIESNLQNGEILNCKVLSLEFNGNLTVQWKISDDELKRFIE